MSCSLVVSNCSPPSTSLPSVRPASVIGPTRYPGASPPTPNLSGSVHSTPPTSCAFSRHLVARSQYFSHSSNRPTGATVARARTFDGLAGCQRSLKPDHLRVGFRNRHVWGAAGHLWSKISSRHDRASECSCPNAFKAAISHNVRTCEESAVTLGPTFVPHFPSLGAGCPRQCGSCQKV